MCQQNVHQRFVLPGDVEAVAPVRDRVLAFLSDHGCLTAGEEFDLRLVLQEALVNAVVHGCRQNSSLTVVCDVVRDPSGVSITVRDPGPGFDPRKLHDPTHGTGLVASAGRGIYIIRSLMDEVRFEAGGSEIRMRKNMACDCEKKPQAVAAPPS
ncbi:MAG TPA: ATP-binding protein [Terriglobales bacterium]|nr:ATP-binding protein [Terriglobales bacterium]